MYKLLIVEDDDSLVLGIEFTLKNEGYEVLRSATFEDGKKLFDVNKFDLIILDINLPDGNGYELCKYIREKNDVPVIFLTALDEEVNLVLGLDIGGDDYITKPFRVKELLSRIKAILRRNSMFKSQECLVSGDISLYKSSMTVKKNGKEIALTAQEYKLLLIFMSKPNYLFKRDEIFSKLFDEDNIYFDENTLSVYIKRIREKIEDNIKEPAYIVTQRGFGYKWAKDVFKEKEK